MSDENKDVSALAGSTPTAPAQADAGQAAQPAAIPAPATPGAQEQTPAPAEDYKSLEKKLGEQGQELGEYREFFKNVSPLLTKLDAQPELIQAILDDKIDTKLVTAVLSGKVKIEEAEQVAQAHQQVKEEMGDKKYEQADPAEIERRILEKVVPEVQRAVEHRLNTAEEIRNFEDSVQTFIASTPDFTDYADKISIWLNEHPDQDDIEVAYSAVKGVELAKKGATDADVATAQAGKDAALNAGGGDSASSGKITPQKSLVDELIAPQSNPNSFRF